MDEHGYRLTTMTSGRKFFILNSSFFIYKDKDNYIKTKSNGKSI